MAGLHQRHIMADVFVWVEANTLLAFGQSDALLDELWNIGGADNSPEHLPGNTAEAARLAAALARTLDALEAALDSVVTPPGWTCRDHLRAVKAGYVGVRRADGTREVAESHADLLACTVGELLLACWPIRDARTSPSPDAAARVDRVCADPALDRIHEAMGLIRPLLLVELAAARKRAAGWGRTAAGRPERSASRPAGRPAPRGKLSAAETDRSAKETTAVYDLISGSSVAAIAKKLGVGRSTLYGWPLFRKALDLVDNRGEAERGRRRGGRDGGDDYYAAQGA